MKLICLNVWGGRAGIEGLRAFFEQHRADTDVFCLQEVYLGGEEHEAKSRFAHHTGKVYDLLSQITEIVSDTHDGYFRPSVEDYYGPALFVRKNISILSEGEVFIYREKGDSILGDITFPPRNFQHLTVSTPKGDRTIINVHGLWNDNGKGDSEDRIKQSEKILSFLSTLTHPYVLCGDFNLTLNTESLAMLERTGLKNLIKDYGITSTRTSHYPKPEKFADYVFITPDIQLNDFRVLPDEVSDHVPLYVDFE